jgi:hypothetical protein
MPVGEGDQAVPGEPMPGLGAGAGFGADLFRAALRAGFLAALFFATTRFFLRAGAAFFAFLAFFALVFRFFAMIVLPIVGHCSVG